MQNWRKKKKKDGDLASSKYNHDKDLKTLSLKGRYVLSWKWKKA